MSFWGELKRRNVVKVGTAYAIVAWLLIQVAATLMPVFGAPDWVLPVFSVFVILGFPLALIVAWAYELTPDGLKPTASVPLSESLTPATGQKLNHIVIGLLGLAVVFLVIDNYVLVGDSQPNVVQQAPAATPESAGAEARDVLEKSVAVLPFANLSPDPANAFFAAGIHEEVLNQLAKLSSLSVISRTTMLRYANSSLSIPEIARELNVETVMEGSVRYGGNRVRITAQLIDPTTDQHLWSETYDREFDDIFAIESDIAMNIANAMEAEFSLAEQRAIERPATVSPEAHAQYLRTSSVSNTPDYVALLDRAIAIDPSFAAAYARRAVANTNLIVNTLGQDAVSAEQRGALIQSIREDAARAQSLDPSLDVAHHVAAVPDVFSWRWSSAITSFERFDASEAAANFDSNIYVWLLSYLGRHEDARNRSQRAMALNPGSWLSHWGYASALAYSGETTAAARVLRAAIESYPGVSVLHHWLSYMEIALGNTDTALPEIRLAEQLLGDNRDVVSLVEIAFAYSRIGRAAEAARLFEEIEALAGSREVGAGAWAVAYLAVGNEPEAIRWLETAIAKAESHEIDAGFWNLMNFKMNLSAAPLLEEPRFVALRNRLVGD